MADQKKNRRKVLVASCILAALILGSSTFAWFTSKDEVTNRLTANSDYGVSVTESFTPPEQWVPGQEINKDVAAVNTGNIDAFVKLSVSNELILTHETAASNTFDAAKGIELSHTTDTSAGLADEVTAIQAGSVLAYTNVDADKTKMGNIVVSKDSGATDIFTPSGTGVYVFRRDVTNESVSGATFTYQGYYYDSTFTKYYAINIETGESVKVDDNGVFIESTAPTIAYRQKETTHVTPTLAYNSTDNKITATYNGATGTGATGDIVININLANDVATNWTNAGNTTDFYLNKILASGATSPDLIDSVTLDENTNSGAYISLDYDLKVALESAQVTYDSKGTVTSDALAAWTYTPTQTETETGTLTWTK